MDTEQIVVKLQETTDRSTRNEGRIKKLEAENDVLHELATSVAVMAEQLKNMNTSVDTLSSKVDDLEKKPGKRWDGLVEKSVWAVAGAVIAWLAAGAPGL